MWLVSLFSDGSSKLLLGGAIFRGLLALVASYEAITAEVREILLQKFGILKHFKWERKLSGRVGSDLCRVGSDFCDPIPPLEETTS